MRGPLVANWALLVLVGAGCRNPFLCTSEYRSVSTRADLVAPGAPADTGNGWFALNLNQWRGGTNANSVTWAFQTPRPAEEVARVEIRPGRGPLGGQLLYTLTTWGDPPWVPPALAPQAYSGPVSFADFFETMLAEDAHVEFTFTGDTTPTLIGRLRVDGEQDWGGKDAYCS